MSLNVSEDSSATCTVYTNNLPEGAIYASYDETHISAIWGDWYDPKPIRKKKEVTWYCGFHFLCIENKTG